MASRRSRRWRPACLSWQATPDGSRNFRATARQAWLSRKAIRDAPGLPLYPERVLENSPLGPGPGYRAVTRHEDVWHVSRHPDLFSHAICLSGTYELSKFLDGEMDDTWYRASPLHFVPDLPEDDPVLQRLRQRFVLIAHGTGRWESPEESWSVAACLGARGVPNRVDEWGDEWDHDWPVWRQMLPQFLDEILPH